MNWKLPDNDKVEHPYKVSEDYFDNLYLTILDSKSEVQNTKKGQFIGSIEFRLALSGVATLMIIVISLFFLNPLQRNQVDELLSDIESEEIINYLVSYEDTEFEILESLESDKLELKLDDYQLRDLDIEEGELEDIYYEYYLDEEISEI
jgi:deoxyxylulose-5-phosphate synthase